MFWGFFVFSPAHTQVVRPEESFQFFFLFSVLY